MDLKEIQNLIRFVSKSGASEVKLEMDDIKITIRTGESHKGETTIVHPIPVSTPAHTPVAPVAEQPTLEVKESEPEATEDSKYITIKSPIIGTFYRKPAPDKPVFVEIGQTINQGDVLCVIEAMKLFNEIESEVSGKIVKVLVDDATPVEFDQPLFLVDPS